MQPLKFSRNDNGSAQIRREKLWDAAGSGMIGNERAAPYESCLRTEPLFRIHSLVRGGGIEPP